MPTRYTSRWWSTSGTVQLRRRFRDIIGTFTEERGYVHGDARCSRKMAFRTDEETFQLIELWGEDNIQQELEGFKRNKDVYLTISKKMNEAGYEKTAEQCRDKAKKLKTTYRKIKDKHSKTGVGRKKWLFLEAMDTVLGDKPSTRPAVLIDTLEPTAEQEPQQELQVQQDTSPPSSEFTESALEAVSSPNSSMRETSHTSDSTGEDGTRSTVLPAVEKRQVKKRSRQERLDKTMKEVVDRVMKAQEASDSKFAGLEEKRMKLEEKILESEERQRREDREFQVRLWMMMMQGMHAPPPPPPPPPPPSSGPFGAVCSPMPSGSDSSCYATSSSPCDYHQPPYLYDQRDQ